MKQLNQPTPKSRIWLYVLLIAVTLGIMFGLRNCRHAIPRAEAVVEGTDTLRVAMQYAPGSFFMQGDTLGGRDYDVLRSLGLPYKIFPITNPAEGLAGLREGRYDLVVADLPMMADSTSEYIFTDPVYIDRQVLVQLGDSITSVLQLEGDTVCVAENSPMAARMANLRDELGADIHIRQLPVTSERLLMDLAQGLDSVKYAVINRTVAQEMSAQYPQLNYSLPISLSQFQPWVLRRDDTALRDTINSRLK